MLRDRALCCWLTLLGLGAPAFTQAAPPLLFEQQLLAPDGLVGFDHSVAVDGAHAAIGLLPFAGGWQVRTLERDDHGWSTAQVVAPAVPDPTPWALSVALDGGTLAVGLSGGQAGRVVVFVRGADGWKSQAELTPPAGFPDEHFGRAVDVAGDTLIVGTHAAGRAWIFERDAGRWSAPQPLVSSSGANEWFGYDVAVSGDVAAVGARKAEPTSIPGREVQYAGAVYVFERLAGSWQQVERFVGDETDMILGTSVAVDGDVLVAGALFGDSAVGDDSGSALVWSREAGPWTEVARLSPGPVDCAPWFGAAVDVCGDTLVVGSPGQQVYHAGHGRAFQYERGPDGWELAWQYGSTGHAITDEFGRVVACSEGRAFVGSLTYAGSSLGRIAIFDDPAGQPAWIDHGSALQGSGFLPPDLLPSGSLQPGSSSTLHVRHAPPSTPAWLVVGSLALHSPLFGGVLVPAPEIVSTGASTLVNGELHASMTWPAHVPSSLEGIWLQWWFADPAAPTGHAATNAYEIRLP